MSRDQGRYLLVVVVLLPAAGVTLFNSRGNRLSLGRALRPATPEYEFVADIDNWQRTERERAVTTPFDFSLSGS